MKSLIKACVLLLLVATLNSCKKEIKTDDLGNKDTMSSVKQGDSTIHKLSINGKPTYVVEVDGIYKYAGDITISQEQFNILKKLANNISAKERATIIQAFSATWPGSVAYYNYPDPAKMTTAQYNSYVSTIDAGLTNITNATGIKFVKRTNQAEYIQFVLSGGNNSPLGWRKNRVNTVNLYNYNYVGILMHEVMHSLGVMHEQCRPDRDQYVIINYGNIQSGLEYNFNTDPNFGGHGPFDFQSVMLYGAYSFSSNGNPTITRLDGSTFNGQRDALSIGDIEGLKALYFPTDYSGVYKITPSYLGTKSFDIFGGSITDGTNIIIWPSHGNANQRFIFRKVEHGYYQIKSSADTNKVLTVRNAGTTNGTQVELRTNANLNNQQFSLKNGGNAGFILSPKHALGLNVEVSGQSTNDAANIVVNAANQTSAAQRFNFTKL
ncbi:hypothetical protein ASE74_19700 [Pedobacter sp. Leaf216]|uniref:M12 family metallopeptidase n=1 Tax=Pedobacter sp. Leaf216 TaxID=1735684 RepID=UPI0006F46B72|nr:M12 family metallopeptidase [Pedobacter sp. Leaf216]KQM76278.1 hypothetical protein ASE74_19700 [Pedobacter sp. Leaf216]